jgi:purine-binding chemotaxis protein CheW
MATGIAEKHAKMSASIHQDKEHISDGALGGKYLTFKLGDEEYGVQILKVREIIGLMDITKVPQMPGYVKGVINLRGKVIPVIDLRSKFCLPEVDYTDQTCIIVIDVGGMVGTIVDSVQEVADISGDQIEPPPPLSADVNSDIILGLAKSKENVKILLDIDKVLDVHQLQGVIESAEADKSETPAAEPQA